MWPDVSEYEKVYSTPFRFADGGVASVFSSYDESTVDTHFRWMKEYGLDGVFMQRFVGEVKNPSGKNHFNKVLASATKAADKYDLHAKLFRFAASKGFEPDIVQSVIQSMKL